MTYPTTKTVKIGTHRGNARVWLQGKWLAAWFAGRAKFTVHFDEDRVIINSASAKQVNARTATFNARGAIIDLNGSDLTATADGATTATVTITAGCILIIPNH